VVRERKQLWLGPTNCGPRKETTLAWSYKLWSEKGNNFGLVLQTVVRERKQHYITRILANESTLQIG